MNMVLQLARLWLCVNGTADMKTFQQLREHIVKVGDKYRLVSKSTGRNLGTYASRSGAERRERQVQYFKHMGENFKDGKNPEHQGDAARHGLTGKSAQQLRTIRSSATASPRKKQLAHWLLNFHHNK
jgi:ribosomal protein L35